MHSRPTIKDVAREARVSIATVSNVLNGTGRVSADTIRKVHSVIENLRFVPSTSARSLRDKNSHLIAVVVPFLGKGRLEDNPFYWQLVAAIEEGARLNRLQVLLVGAEEHENFSFVHERHLDGLIVVGIDNESPLLANVLNLNVPTVFMDSYLADPSLFQVTIDDETGGYLGTKHLIELGHTRIAVLTGTLRHQGVNYYRHAGYLRALQEAGLSYDERLVIQGPVSSKGGYEAAQLFNNGMNRASAVFAFSDIAAIGFIKGMDELGMKVPKDLSVLGFDDIPYCSFMVPSLTSVRQNIHAKGKTAVDLLYRQIYPGSFEEGRNTMLPVELMIRQSTRHRD